MIAINESNLQLNIKSKNDRSIPLAGNGKIVIKEKYQSKPRSKKLSNSTNNINNTNNTNTISDINDINDKIQTLPSYFRTIDSINKDEKTLIQLKCYSGITSINENSVKITKIDESIFNTLRPLTRNSPSPSSDIEFNDDSSQGSLIKQFTNQQATIKAVNKNTEEGIAFLNDTTAQGISNVWNSSDNNHLLLPVSGPDLISIKKYKMGAASASLLSSEHSKPGLIEVLDKEFLELFDKKTLPPIYQTTIHDRIPNPNPNMGDLIRTVSAKSMREKLTSSPSSPSSPNSASKAKKARPTSPMTDTTSDVKIAIKKNSNLDLYNTINPSPKSAQMVGAHNRSESPLYHPSTFRRPVKSSQEYHYDDYDESIPSKSFSLDDLGGNVGKQRSTWVDDERMFDGKGSISPTQSVSSGAPKPIDNPQLNRSPKSPSRGKKYNPVRIDSTMDDDNVMTCATCQVFSAYWCQKCLLSYCPNCWDKVDHHLPLELVLSQHQAEDISISPQYSRASSASGHEPERSIASSGGDGVSIKISKPKPLKYQDYPEPPIIMDSRGAIHQEKDFIRSTSRSPSRTDSSDKFRSESPYGDYSYSRPESPGIYTYDPNQGGSRSLEGLSNSHIIITKKDPMLQMRLDYIKSLENAKLDVLIKHYESKQSTETLFESSKRAQARAEETKRRIESIKKQLIEEKKKRKKEGKPQKNIQPKKKKKKPKYIPPVAFAIDAGGCTICPRREQPKHMRALKNYSHLKDFPGTSETIYPNDRKEIPPPIVQTVGNKTVYLKEPLPIPEPKEKKKRKEV